MDKKVGWGIFGCAGIAEKAFIPAVNASRNGFLAAIASRDEAQARAWAVRFDIHTVLRTYQDLVEDPTVAAVYIPLPNHLHAEWAVRALRAGKHVLCEKPLAMNAAEAICSFENVRFTNRCEAHESEKERNFMTTKPSRKPTIGDVIRGMSTLSTTPPHCTTPRSME